MVKRKHVQRKKRQMPMEITDVRRDDDGRIVVSGVDTDGDPENNITRFYLVSGSYHGKRAVASAMISRVVGELLSDTSGVEPAMTITYQMPYFLRPEQFSLREIWKGMSAEEIEEFAERYDDLATAIAIMCDGPDQS